MTGDLVTALRRVLVEELGHDPTGVVGESLPERAARLIAEVGPAADGLARGDLGEAVRRQVVAALTVGETSFFRDARAFAVLRQRVAPALLGREVVRVWSAGCSTGMETYSIAHCLRHALAGEVRLLGTDVCEERLALARRGLYPLRTVRGPLPEDFATQEGDSARVRRLPRAHLEFRVHNLVGDLPPGRFDLVVCRNVLLYLRPEARLRAWRTLVDSVLPGGWLLLGEHDRIPRPRDMTATDVPNLLCATAQAAEGPGRDSQPPSPPLRRSAPETLLARAQRLLRIGDEAGAESACLEALDRAPADVDAVLLLAQLARRRGDDAVARCVLAAVAEVAPTDTRIRLALAALEGAP